jgi:hypothetical protein
VEHPRKRFNEELEKIAHSAELFLWERIDEIVGLLALLYEIKSHIVPPLLLEWLPIGSTPDSRGFSSIKPIWDR